MADAYKNLLRARADLVEAESLANPPQDDRHRTNSASAQADVSRWVRIQELRDHAHDLDPHHLLREWVNVPQEWKRKEWHVEFIDAPPFRPF